MAVFCRDITCGSLVYLALPLGELSAKLTERVFRKPSAMSMVPVPPEGDFLVPARKSPKKPAGEGLNAIAPAIEPPPQTPPGDASPGVLVYMVLFKKRYIAIGAVPFNWLGNGQLFGRVSIPFANAG